MRTRFVCAVLLLLHCVGLAAQDVVADRVAAPMVALEGTIKSRRVWGPPGFGETPKRDSRTTIYVLKLKKPRTAAELPLDMRSNREPARKYSEVQLFCDPVKFARCEAAVRSSVGREVTVSGRVDFAVEPTDYVSITMEVLAIQRE
jgi:hypothetical protein